MRVIKGIDQTHCLILLGDHLELQLRLKYKKRRRQVRGKRVKRVRFIGARLVVTEVCSSKQYREAATPLQRS